MVISAPPTVREAYYSVLVKLKTGRELALIGEYRSALEQFQGAIHTLRLLPPDRTRDILLAHGYLNRFQTLTMGSKKPSDSAEESLLMGVSYARSTRDPMARALAEECLNGRFPG
ncbi:MAG TPA: hypothetical protein VHN99_00320 [Deinococcales bacterium]|nr:hypothetical protein [Deinococcales bacterium]